MFEGVLFDYNRLTQQIYSEYNRVKYQKVCGA